MVFIVLQAMEQSQRYESLSGQCRAVLATTDLAHFVRSLNGPHHSAPRHNFAPPQPPPPPEIPDGPNSAEAAPAVRRNQVFNKVFTVLCLLAGVIKTKYNRVSK